MKNIVAIPKKITLRRKPAIGEILKRGEKDEVTEEDVLRWSTEARELKKAGKLPILRSLKEFRSF